MFENLFLSLALIFILGFFLSKLISKSRIPPTTTYVLLGILCSPNLLGIISPKIITASDLFSSVVLGFIAFNLGRSLSFDIFRRVGKVVTAISLSASIVPWLLVTLFLWLVLKQPFVVALLFGAISAATDPASTVAIAQEYRSKGSFTDTLLGVVAVDDLWALIIFAFSLVFVQVSFVSLVGFSAATRGLSMVLFDIGGSLFAGIMIGFIFNFFLRFVGDNQERLIYTLGFLFLAVGVAIFFDLSVLLTCMFFGAFFVNLNKRNSYIFETIDNISGPLYLMFFVLAGAHMRFDILSSAVFLVGIIFILRSFGKIAGSFFGARAAEASSDIQKYMGIALLPQAGVALGCALVAKHHLNNNWGDLILTVTIGTTVIFELFGPWFTKLTLAKAENIR